MERPRTPVLSLQGSSILTLAQNSAQCQVTEGKVCCAAATNNHHRHSLTKRGLPQKGEGKATAKRNGKGKKDRTKEKSNQSGRKLGRKTLLVTRYKQPWVQTEMAHNRVVKRSERVSTAPFVGSPSAAPQITLHWLQNPTPQEGNSLAPGATALNISLLKKDTEV